MVEQQLITARNDLTLAQMRLAQLIGLPEDKTCEVSGVLDSSAVPDISDQSITEALLNRVEIKQSQTDIERSDATLRLAQSDYLPTVGAFAVYQLNAKDAPFTSATP